MVLKLFSASVLFIGIVLRIPETESACASPNSPGNGFVRCAREGIFLTCTGTCNAGYKFETGEQSITKVCNQISVSPASATAFPKCIKGDCLGSLLSNVNTSTLAASSVWNGVKGYYFGAERGRISSELEVKDGVVQSAGWRSSINTLDQYIQVELSSLQRIVGVVTKGRAVASGDTANEYVTRYRVLYSTDGTHWQPYSTKTVSDKFLDGNTDNTSPKTNLFACPFNARFVRLNPLAWHSNIAMRFDLLGCETDGSQPACSTDTTSAPTATKTTLAPTIKVPTPPVNLCSSIPPPQDGAINCETMGDRLVCVANCNAGYVFETKEQLVKRVCMRQTGTWPSTASVPRCIYNNQVTPRPLGTNGCITHKQECDDAGNGDFQACGGCHFFATCSEGYLYVRACPENLVFDQVSMVCDYHSRTCTGDNVPIG